MNSRFRMISRMNSLMKLMKLMKLMNQIFIINIRSIYSRFNQIMVLRMMNSNHMKSVIMIKIDKIIHNQLGIYFRMIERLLVLIEKPMNK